MQTPPPKAPTIPPHVLHYLESERAAQASHVRVALAQRNTRDALDTLATRVVPALLSRGHQLDTVEEHSLLLEQSSEDFVFELQPAWRQWLRTWRPPMWWWPRWMFRWCGAMCRACYPRAGLARIERIERDEIV